MNDHERQFQEIVGHLPLEDQPDCVYRQALREKILSRFDAKHPADLPSGTKKRLHVHRRIVQFAAAAIVVLAVGTMVLLMTVGQGPGIAFADVQRQIRDAKTLSCILTVIGKGSATAAPGKKITKTYLVNEKGEIVKETVEEEALKPAKQTEQLLDVNCTMKISTKEPGFSRVDIVKYKDGSCDVLAGTYSITDSRNGKTAFFQPKQRLYIIEEFPKGQPLSLGFESVFQQCMDSIKSAEATPLGQKKIDGRLANGYKISNGEVWADAKTAEPILIQIRDKDPKGNVNTVEISQIQINKPLEDALFSMDVPKGYTDLKNLKTEDIRNATPGENQTIFILPSVSVENEKP